MALSAMRNVLVSLFLSITTIGLSSPVKSMLGAESSFWEEGLKNVSEVEYLESTGTQYILLDVLVDGIECYILPQRTVSSNYGAVGRWNGGSRADSILFNTLRNVGWCIQTLSFSGVETHNMIYELMYVRVSIGQVIIGDSIYSMGNWGATSYEHKFSLFGCYNTSTRDVTCQSCKIGRCNLYYNDTLLYSFIPMRVGIGKESIGCMYDQVSGEYFYNQGTGFFIIGPDVR